MTRLSFRFLLGASLAIAAIQVAIAQPASAEKDRLLATARLWVTIQYFHPYLAYRHIDWDRALIDALPAIRSAQSDAEYAAAVQKMLGVLNDPATYVRNPAPVAPVSLKLESGPGGVLIVSEQSAAAPTEDAVQRLVAAITSASNVVFDLRSPNPYLAELLDRRSIQHALAAGPLETPGQRTWIHKGLSPEAGSATEAYYSAFHVKPGERVSGSSAGHSRRYVFLLGAGSRLPVIATALASSGSAAILTEAPHYELASSATATVELTGNLEASVRLSEPVFANGTGLPDIPLVSPDTAMARAITALHQPAKAPIGPALPPYPLTESVHSYENSSYPSTLYRILAAYRIWGAVRYFFAYKDLMDEDWDDVFADFLPKFIAAKDAREYNLTIADMLTHIADSGAQARSEILDAYFGKAPVGLRMRLIQKKPVITEILDQDARKAGVQVGDIVTKVDGEDIIARFRREAGYISGSTSQALGYAVIERILNGADGSAATLTIKDRKDALKQVTLKRSISYTAALGRQRSGDVLKIFPGDVGYVDLERLRPNEVDAMFDKFRDLKAIIFDGRGNVEDTASMIAPRLTGERDVPAAIITGPLALAPDLVQRGSATSTASYFFVQTLPEGAGWKYKGKTVMLVDERTRGAAEHAALFFEVANKTEFIGTPSAGADADPTNLVAPGGITISFSGNDIRHANGGKLQRLGLQPSVTVAPTVNGIRDGRDEVLEKALEYLSGSEGARRMAIRRGGSAFDQHRL